VSAPVAAPCALFWFICRSAGETSVLLVKLYTKPGCGLCDEALDLLAEMASQVQHEVREVNIADDPALFDAFWDKIPVVEVGTLRLEAPLDEEGLLEALRAAQSEEN
jgi:thiol-disulfide isomerase/thioredoxin